MEQDSEPELESIPLDHPSIPACIRESVEEYWQEGDLLYALETDDGMEWWLLDCDDELVDIFWVETR